MSNTKYYMFLNYVPNIWNGVIKKLLIHFEHIEAVYMADEKELSEAGIEEKYVKSIIDTKKIFDFEKNMEYLERNNIRIITIEQREYPERLKNIEDMPYCLYVKGKLPEGKRSVAIVGARACSNYGIEMARKTAKSMSQAGIDVISGMARGIDTFAHLGALDGGGKTYAVLGCGVDVCYPTENIELYEQIEQKGGIISEYYPGAKPVGWRFPMRNRIISGLSDALIVVEARIKSGSLITAEQALDQGKDVYAIPGRITDELSIGCNRLINDGARAVTDIAETVKEIFADNAQIIVKNEKNNNLLEKDFEVVYSETDLSPISFQELADRTGIESGRLYGILLQLQLKKLIYEPAKNYYARYER